MEQVNRPPNQKQLRIRNSRLSLGDLSTYVDPKWGKEKF